MNTETRVRPEQRIPGDDGNLWKSVVRQRHFLPSLRYFSRPPGACGQPLLPRLLLFTAMCVAEPARAGAAEVVVLGDGFGAFMGDSVRTTLDARGLKSMRIHNAAIPGSTADEWRRGTHGVMTTILKRDTNALAIHLFLGGNDILSRLPNTNAAAAAVRPAATNVVRVLAAIASASPAPILYSSYYYLPGPARTGGTALQINRWVVELFDDVAAQVKADPVLRTRVTALSNFGLMQLHYGIPQLGIPPWDPSLPDGELPGPAIAFADDVHLTRAGLDIFFRKLYADFCAPLLERSVLVVRGSGRVEIRSAPGLQLTVLGSADLQAWAPLAHLTNTTGTMIFENAEYMSSGAGYGFYRGRSVEP